MPTFRVHRLKESPRQQFRWAPHVTGETGVKPKDYEAGGTVEAANEYDAWTIMKASETPLGVGDVLENEAGQLRICKYAGFDAAHWIIPEVKPRAEGLPEPVASEREEGA